MSRLAAALTRRQTARSARGLHIDANIALARTPPGSLYRPGAAAFAAQLERVFARSWQLAPELASVRAHGEARPFKLLRGALDEPLVAVRDGGSTRCLSNVCTHRGMELVPDSGAPVALPNGVLRCGYHGRRFSLDGRVRSAPGFEALEHSFEDLPSARTATWRGALPFVSLGGASRPLERAQRAAGEDDAAAFDAAFGDALGRLAMLPVERLEPDATGTRSFEVRCHWALYVENYLEGLHVPFVHPSLQQAISMGDSRIETFGNAVLQVGAARASSDAASLLPPAPDRAGERVAAYYLYLFPNTMLNFYDWGVSVNIVVPTSPATTRIDYLRYVWNHARVPAGAGAAGAGGDLDAVELEDDAVVEAVQRGVGARLYGRGRYAGRHELGTHHFHRLLQAALGDTSNKGGNV